MAVEPFENESIKRVNSFDDLGDRELIKLLDVYFYKYQSYIYS